ncbi:hypothetical protein N7582_004636 [Saccharomyces uvarum]|nr:hypothetical protein N7582_004636 [Saccharomyces uvarum]
MPIHFLTTPAGIAERILPINLQLAPRLDWAAVELVAGSLSGVATTAGAMAGAAGSMTSSSKRST